jgi:hypothetical protein
MNIYESNILNRQIKKTENLINNRQVMAKNPESSNIIPRFYNNKDMKHTILMDYSDKLTDDNFVSTFDFSTTVKPLENKKNQFIELFENQKINRDNIKTNNTFDINNFTPFNNNDMTYGIIDKEDFTHTNMVPFTRGNGLEHNNINIENRNFMVELFTGSSKNYVPKKEVPRLFLPEKDVTFGATNGMPVQTDFLQSRFYVSEVRQGEKPFEPVRIKPGLAQDYYGEKEIGYHDSYRVLPKSVDDLRNNNKPKLTYNAPILEGQKGMERPIQSNVIKRGPAKFKEYSEERHLPFGGEYRGPTTRDKYVLKENARVINKEIVGTAHHSSGNFQYLYEKKNYTTNKNEYDPITPSGLKTQYDYVPAFPMPSTFDVQEQQRQTTNIVYQGVAGESQKGKAINYNDTPKSTVKESTIINPYKGGVVTNSISAPRSRLYDDPKSTLKQINIDNKYIGGISGQLSAVQMPIQDDIKQTTKQTTIDNKYLGSVTNQYNTIQTPIQDDIKQTTKQTTIDNKYLGSITNQYNTIQTPIQDDIKQTTKQTTINNKYLGGLSSQVSAIQTPMQDHMKPTTKQTTINNKHILGTTFADGKAPTAYFTDSAKTTIKQTTENTRHINGVATNGMEKPTTHLQDDAKITTKQTTINNTYLSGITPIYSAPKTQLQDDARITVKQTTINNNYIGPIGTTEINAPQNRSAEENMCIDDKREYLIYRKAPTNVGKFEGPDKKNINMTQCKDPLLYNHMNGPYSQQIGSLNYMNTKNKQSLMNITTDRINPYLVSSLTNNPLINNVIFQKGNKTSEFNSNDNNRNNNMDAKKSDFML